MVAPLNLSVRWRGKERPMAKTSRQAAGKKTSKITLVTRGVIGGKLFQQRFEDRYTYMQDWETIC